LEKFYDDHEKKLNYQSILHRKFAITEKLTKTAIYIYAFSLYLPFIASIKAYVVNGKFLLPTPINLPYIDHLSTFGFLLNLIILIMIDTLAFFALIGYDSGIVLYGTQCIPFIEILMEKVSELQREIEEKSKNLQGMSSHLSIRDNSVHKLLIEVITSYNDYRDFIGHEYFNQNIPM
jgi:hypothetical protein